MSSVVALVAALIAFSMASALADGRWSDRVSPRLLATAHVAGLLGWGVLPAASLACLGSSVAMLASSPSPLASGCWLGVGVGSWRLVGYGLAAAGLAPLVWQAVRVLLASHRGELRGPTLAAGRRSCPASGTSVWVLPSSELVARAGGVLHPRAMVTTAVLARLSPGERGAVLEHEAAHIRLGHPRLLIFGAIVARAYGLLPPVRRSWAALRRETEAAADAEAVRYVGRRTVISALARLSLARVGLGASFGDPDLLRYRLRRLQRDAAPRRTPTVVVASVSVGLLVVLAWSVCSLLLPHLSVPALAGCLALGGALVLRPVWTRSFPRQ